MSEIYGESLVFAGGGGNIFAYIAVTYPSGAVCTCTGNGKTLRAKDTGGKVIFGVNKSGTYTVEAINGEDSSSRELNIVIEGSVSEIELWFAPEWYNTLKTQSVGDTLVVDEYEWIIVNKTSVAAVLGLSTIYSLTIFGSNNMYESSRLASVAANFEAQNLSAETKQCLNNVTVNNVTAKVFVPSYEQMNGGFAQYNSNDNRLCKYNGTNDFYWISSPYDSVALWSVYNTGILYKDNPTSTQGFRPHIEVNLTF